MNFHKAPTNRRTPKNKVKAILLSNSLVVIAIGLLLIGSGISLYDWRTNEVANWQATKLIYAANHNINHNAPSTIKPTASVVANYVVAPTPPRYLIIPELNVDAPILSVGVNAQGVLETPDNIYDTAWYDESAQPGQLGAMLIDGHISSWTAQGVFYGLKTLQPGDAIDVQGGNGAVFTYQVVKIQVYDANNVDMGTAMVSINPSKPGLNLISCTGDVIQGTNEFNERIVVFAVET
jgi:LPXTG-site transpeptidase (sortase) family protein